MQAGMDKTMAKRLFGVEINGERKPLFSSRGDAKKIAAAVVANGGTARVFEHYDIEIRARNAEAAETRFFNLGMQYYIAARLSVVLAQLAPVCGNLCSSPSPRSHTATSML
jgi:hypothetical protein